MYVEQENSKIREQYRLRGLQNLYDFALSISELVLEVFFTALGDCADVIGASVPNIADRLLAPRHITISQDGRIIFTFRFYLKHGASKMTASQLAQYLQYELDRICTLHNLPPLLVHIRIHPNNHLVIAEVYLLENYRAVKNKDVVL